MISLFKNKQKLENIPIISNKITEIVRICVCATADDPTETCGKAILDSLQGFDGVSAGYTDYCPLASVLDINAKNLLEIPEIANKILRRKKYDVIIFSHIENNLLVLNFFTAGEYENAQRKRWRVFDCLYLPMNFFENAKFCRSGANLVAGAALLCKDPSSPEEKKSYFSLLKNIISFLCNDETAGDVPFQCMPYILSLLGSLYLEYFSARLTKKRFSDVKYIFEKALGHKAVFAKKIHIAPIYIHLGNLFSLAAEHSDFDAEICYKKAVQSYRLAQGYFPENIYPYEYAWISCLCAEAFLQKWQYFKSVESLRDSVSSFQSAQKIFTDKATPKIWGSIEEKLGYNLLSLGCITQSQEILNLSIVSFCNAQNIFSKQKYPQKWIALENGIANAYYTFGKKYRSLDFLKKAEKHLHEAIRACEEFNQTSLLRKLDMELSKVSELMFKFKKK